MDLTAAEAVIDLIDAETVQEAHNAALQLNGAVARPAGQVYDALMEIASRFYAVVDYPDEDIEPLQQEEIACTLQEGETALRALLSTAERGRILKKGVRTAIVGRPNVGKSSLLNALLGYERAIVTDVAGTTRDTVEEKVLCGGVLLRLTDTAGIPGDRGHRGENRCRAFPEGYGAGGAGAGGTGQLPQRNGGRHGDLGAGCAA